MELELLLSLDGGSYEAAPGYVVEFVVRRTAKSPARPHGISYSLVFRPKGGKSYVRFDNAHRVRWSGGRFVKQSGRPRPLAPDRNRPRTAVPIHDRDATARRLLAGSQTGNERKGHTE